MKQIRINNHKYDVYAIVSQGKKMIEENMMMAILIHKDGADLSPMTPFEIAAYYKGEILYIDSELKRRRLDKHGTRFNREDFMWITRTLKLSDIEPTNNNFMSSLKSEPVL
ncbi:hypothetical protein_gp257 [Bacillus phage vB_BceM_WH1]|nr:hypothetical protein_gp257 [Bacillus phage vB_BceM_WH1]